MVARGEIAPSSTEPSPQDRWTLNRAGIINVYQYEDETLHFGGGRLLLPFLITASRGGSTLPASRPAY